MRINLALITVFTLLFSSCADNAKRVYVRDSLPDEKLYHVFLDNELRLLLLDEKEVNNTNRTSTALHVRTRPDLKSVTAMITFADGVDYVYSDEKTVDVKGGEGKGVVICSNIIGLDPQRKKTGRNIYVDLELMAVQIETSEEIAALSGKKGVDLEKVEQVCASRR